MRKLLAALLGVTLLFPIIAGPVAANHAVACEEASSGGDMAGEFSPNNSRGYNGVEAYAISTGTPQTCVQVSGDTYELHSLTSYWVGLQDSQGTGIVQLGVTLCSGSSDYWQGTDPCDSAYRGSWRLFWAYSGCNLNLPWPRDLGAANPYNAYKLSVYHNSTVIRFVVNGDVRAEIPYSQMSCWSDTGDKAVFACETKDNGDSCGGYASHPVDIYNIRTRYADNFSWTGVNTVSAPCVKDGSNGGRYQCAVTSGNSISLWSQN